MVLDTPILSQAEEELPNLYNITKNQTSSEQSIGNVLLFAVLSQSSFCHTKLRHDSDDG